jgi:putative transposase
MWCPQACRILKIKHRLHSSYEKSIIIERTIQSIKDRTESFDDDYFPCTKSKCKLQHIRNWLTYLLAVIIEAILNLTEPTRHKKYL